MQWLRNKRIVSYATVFVTHECMDTRGKAMHYTMDGLYYDFKEGIGKVESGTETGNNAGAAVVEE